MPSKILVGTDKANFNRLFFRKVAKVLALYSSRLRVTLFTLAPEENLFAPIGVIRGLSLFSVPSVISVVNP